ncbi:MAG TPA: c-type cytochrome [Caldilineaceae bacterium]|nr:c-type cytochrome [Caldilineaceae bacterium]
MMKRCRWSGLWHFRRVQWLGLLLLLTLGGCIEMPQERVVVQETTAGNSEAGRLTLASYGCNACHHIPGVSGPNSYVGPPLDAWAERSYIAGSLPNEPEYLKQWIRFPQAIDPGTAMPNLEVSDEDASNMAAYLYTLRSDRDWYASARAMFGLNND